MTDKEVSPEDKDIEIAEAAVGIEFRPELVCQEDIALITKMTKDELSKYSQSRLGKGLDLSRRVKMLQLDVVLMVKNKLKIPTDTVGKKPEDSKVEILDKETPEFIFEPKRRRVFEWTSLLAKRDDLIECWLVDKKGKKL